MRRIIVLLVFMLILCMGLAAQQISIMCNPGNIFVNSLNTGSFDPVNPQNQPILTTVTITNLTQTPFRFELEVIILWNMIEIVDVTYLSKYQLQANETRIYTNRDLITNNATNDFEAPDNEISISDIMNTNSVLRDALQAGFFPDGTLRFIIKATPLDIPNPETTTSNYDISIKNINAIFLSYPGRPIGQNPPEVNVRPVSFLWNFISNNINKFRLDVKEFMPDNPPDINSVETGGKRVFNQILQDNIFTDFLPFQDKHYYAWQVSTGLYSETEYLANEPMYPESNVLKSDWFVFKYASDFNSDSITYQQLMMYLNMLNNEDIKYIFSQGFEVTGAVFYEGQVYTDKDAVDLVKTMLGKEIEVEITEK